MYSHYSFNVILEILVNAIRKEEIKGLQIEQEEQKLLLFKDGMVVYVEKSKKSTKQEKTN